MQNFGQWIKKRRHEKHIGLYRCAGYAGIGGEALRLIEAGKTNPANCKVSTLYALARVLELDLMTVIESAISQDNELTQLYQFCQKWQAKEREYYFQQYPKYARLVKVGI